MATGLWNVGGVNIPDFGISEFFNVGPRNAAIDAPQMSQWQQYSQSLPQNTNLSSNASPALNVAPPTTVRPAVNVPTNNIPTPQAVPTPNAPTQVGPSNNDLQRQIDELGSSAIGAYGRLEDLYRGQAASAETSLGENVGQAKSALEEAYSRAGKTIAQQGTSLFESQRSQEAALIREANAAQQRANVGYGGGSSTLSAMSQIVYSAFLQASGGLKEKYASGQMQINQAQQNTEKDYTMAIGDLETKRIQMVRDIGSELETRLNQINMAKATIEDDKRQMRAELLVQAHNAALQMAADTKSKIFDLGQWKIMRDEELGKSQKFLDDLAAQTMADIRLRQQQMQNDRVNFQTGTQVQTPGTQFRSPGIKEDPYASLIST